jgi:hypothetical protein
MNITIGATSGIGTGYPSGAPEFTPRYKKDSCCSIISFLWSALGMETGVPAENHRLVASHRQTLSHNIVHLAQIKIRTHNISGSMYAKQKLKMTKGVIHRVCSTNITFGATSGTGTSYPSEAPEFTPRFKRDSCCSIISFLWSVLGIW